MYAAYLPPLSRDIASKADMSSCTFGKAPIKALSTVYSCLVKRSSKVCRQQGMLKNPESGVIEANNGIQGVNSSAWLPIRNDPLGNGGSPSSSKRHISGGDSVVVLKSTSGPHKDQDLRARRSTP